MFGSKARRIKQLETDIESYRAVIQRSKTNMTRMREILHIADSVDIYAATKEFKGRMEKAESDLQSTITILQGATRLLACVPDDLETAIRLLQTKAELRPLRKVRVKTTRKKKNAK